MYENKDFEGQLIRLFESVEGRIGSLYGAISSRLSVEWRWYSFQIGRGSNRNLVRNYFKSVEKVE
jgi:hypothetical protein